MLAAIKAAGSPELAEGVKVSALTGARGFLVCDLKYESIHDRKKNSLLIDIANNRSDRQRAFHGSRSSRVGIAASDTVTALVYKVSNEPNSNEVNRF